MDVTAASLRAQFETLSATELQAIVASGSYSETAQQVAREVLSRRRSTPLTRPCPVHAESQVVGNCERCGTFICLECDPAWGRLRRGQCGACQQRVASGAGVARPARVGVALLGVSVLIRVLNAVGHAFGQAGLLVASVVILGVVALVLLRRRAR
jgi:hypothetical protein